MKAFVCCVLFAAALAAPEARDKRGLVPAAGLVSPYGLGLGYGGLGTSGLYGGLGYGGLGLGHGLGYGGLGLGHGLGYGGLGLGHGLGYGGLGYGGLGVSGLGHGGLGYLPVPVLAAAPAVVSYSKKTEEHPHKHKEGDKKEAAPELHAVQAVPVVHAVPSLHGLPLHGLHGSVAGLPAAHALW